MRPLIAVTPQKRKRRRIKKVMSQQKTKLENQPKLFKELYKTYLSPSFKEAAPEEQESIISNLLIELGKLSPENASLTARFFIKNMQKIEKEEEQQQQQQQKGDPKEEKEKDTKAPYIEELSSSLAWLSTAQQQAFAKLVFPSPSHAALLLSFIVYANSHPHRSGWIYYDKKAIFYLASIDKKRVADQQLLTKYLHDCYNLNMQVVGSTQPISCFHLDITKQQQQQQQDQQQQQQQEENGEVIVLGPLTPETITNYVSSLKTSIDKKKNKSKSKDIKKED